MDFYINKATKAADKNIVLDDLILTKDLPTTAGSKMLEHYKSLFEAEVVTKLSAAGYTVCGKAKVGEMNLDLLGETSYFGACSDENGMLLNPCAELVKAKEAMAALMLDVNGTPARAAAVSGLVSVKPTYGTISRFGTIPAACSGDTVSVLAENSAACREVLLQIAGHDDKDGTSLPEALCEKLKADAPKGAIKKVVLAKALYSLADDEMKAKIDGVKNSLEANGVTVTEIDAEILALAKAAWNILMSAEVCNNVSRYDGVKYGYRTPNYTNIDELYTNSRTESFGYLLKSTVLFGSDTLSTDNYMKIYDKALRMRRVIREAMEAILKDADAIMLPACSKLGYTLDEAQENKYIAYEESVFTAPASITGLPAVCVSGVQFLGNAFSETAMLDLAEMLEKEGK